MSLIPRGAELLRSIIDSRLMDVHTALPCEVLAFDAAAQTVDVQPMIKNVIIDPDGTELEESYPQIKSVPVQYPRSGKYIVAFPLEVGDFVTVVFHEWSNDNFIEQGKEVHPIDPQRHGFSGAVAFPGGPYPVSEPITETIDGLLVGYDGGAFIRVDQNYVHIGDASGAEFIAQATKTLDRLTAIVNGYNTHIHTSGVGPTGVPTVTLSAPASVAATIGKVT